jgi:hypothetical protein
MAELAYNTIGISSSMFSLFVALMAIKFLNMLPRPLSPMTSSARS